MRSTAASAAAAIELRADRPGSCRDRASRGRGWRRSPSPRRRRGRSRPGPARAPALSGPTCSTPPASTRAIEPPPAPMLTMSSALQGDPLAGEPAVGGDRRPRPRRPARCRCWCRPCRTGCRSPSPTRRAAYWLPATPPAGPESTAAGREPHRFRNGRDAAVRLDDQDRARKAGLLEPGREPGQIALQHRADVGVDDRRADPLVLLDLRQHLGRRRDVDARQRGAHRVRGLALVPRHRARRAESRSRPPRRRSRASAAIAASSEARSSGVSIRPSARIRSRTPRRQLARHQRHGRRLAQVVAVVLQAFAHLDHVAMALGGEQADPGALALEQRVGRDGRAVDDAARSRPAGRARSSRAPPPAARARPSRPSDWSAGVEAALAMVTRPAASTATRSVKVPPTSMPMRYMAQRPAPTVTKPTPTSRARSVRERVRPDRRSRRRRRSGRGGRRPAGSSRRSPWS